MKKLIIIFITLCSLNNTHANDSLFLQANEEYINEKYEIAISIYDTILSNGFQSSELFYNLGNCYLVYLNIPQHYHARTKTKTLSFQVPSIQ